MSRKAHAMTELAYQQFLAKPGDSDWTAKQRILLADMALHLLQTALGDGDLSETDLKGNLFSILNISDQFVAGHDLKAGAALCSAIRYTDPSSHLGIGKIGNSDLGLPQTPIPNPDSQMGSTSGVRLVRPQLEDNGPPHTVKQKDV